MASFCLLPSAFRLLPSAFPLRFSIHFLYPFIMPGAERAEIYFIVAMMVLILILSVAAVIFFVKQYRKEMRDKEDRIAKKSAEKAQQEQ